MASMRDSSRVTPPRLLASRAFTSTTSGTPGTPWPPHRGEQTELMARMGHSSPRATLIDQHATRNRDAAIADSLSDLIQATMQPNRTQLTPSSR